MDTLVTVKAVIRNQHWKYLIVKEGSRWHDGEKDGARWQAVGGRIEDGEKLKDCLRREVKEETGIEELKIDKVIHVDEWFSKINGQLKHVVALFFLCRVKSSNVALSEEHDEYMWVTVDQLDNFGDAIEKEIRDAIVLASKTEPI